MNIGGIGPLELFIVIILALVVIGPERLPEVARKLGQIVAQFRQMSDELTRDLALQLDEETRALQESAASGQPAEPASTPPIVSEEVAVPQPVPEVSPPLEVDVPALEFEAAPRRRTHRLPLWSECAIGLPGDLKFYPASGKAPADGGHPGRRSHRSSLGYQAAESFQVTGDGRGNETPSAWKEVALAASSQQPIWEAIEAGMDPATGCDVREAKE